MDRLQMAIKSGMFWFMSPGISCVRPAWPQLYKAGLVAQAMFVVFENSTVFGDEI